MSNVPRASTRMLRIGFIDLIDAAPLIIAFERGYFADEGLHVELDRQLGWGSIRDRLTFGQLDAAHALVGMPLFSQLKRDRFVEPLVSLMNLGSGGDAITLSRRLIDAGVRSPQSLGKYIRDNGSAEPLVLGHVFSCSMHHYLLRDWLSSGGIDADRDVRLRVFPPNQLAGHMAHGHVSGFCVGEPWNMLAQREATGQIVALTCDILPNHPDKVLAVTRRWMDLNQPLLVPMIRAILRGAAFCEDPRNHDELAEVLSRAHYLNAPRNLLRESLGMDVAGGGGCRMRSFAPEALFPSPTHAAWMASQMIRWRHLPQEADLLAVAGMCSQTVAYREAAGMLGLSCPEDDFAPMPLRQGVFDPRDPRSNQPRAHAEV